MKLLINIPKTCKPQISETPSTPTQKIGNVSSVVCNTNTPPSIFKAVDINGIACHWNPIRLRSKKFAPAQNASAGLACQSVTGVFTAAIRSTRTLKVFPPPP